MGKTLQGTIHGRTIELDDDPGISEGARVIVQLQSNGDAEKKLADRPTKGPPVEEVLGLWNPLGVTPPDDAECQRIIEEELLKKHSP